MYPKHGGIGALANTLAKCLNISLSSEVVEIRPSKTEVIVKYTRNGNPKET